jgi:hypothetical protein
MTPPSFLPRNHAATASPPKKLGEQLIFIKSDINAATPVPEI